MPLPQFKATKMQLVLKVFSLCLLVVALVFCFLIFPDVKSFADFKALITLEFVDPRIAPFDKQSYCFFPYLLCSIIASIGFAINSSWVKWNRQYLRILITAILIILFLFLFFGFSENFGSYSDV